MTTETVTWRPIDTATKDREVLLWWPQFGPWRGHRGTTRWFSPGVALNECRHIRELPENQPTHWAELLRGPGELESER